MRYDDVIAQKSLFVNNSVCDGVNAKQCILNVDRKPWYGESFGTIFYQSTVKVFVDRGKCRVLTL